MKICPKCGTKNKDVSNFCASCGAKLENYTTAFSDDMQFDDAQPQHDEVRSVGTKKPKSVIVWLLIVAAAAVLIAAFAIGAGGFNHRNDTAEEALVIDEDETDDEAASEDSTDQDDRGVYDAYYDVLIDNIAAITAYSDQYGSTAKCIAISDISGDAVPELMFFSGELTCPLRVFTYLNGEAVECDFDDSSEPAENINRQDGYIFDDVFAASGTSYMIYTGKTPGEFYIAYYIGDESSFYNSVRYNFEGDSEIAADKVVSNTYGPTFDLNGEYTGDRDDYDLNGSKVSSERGIAEFKADREDMDRLLMYKGYVEDMKVFEATKNESTEALTWDEAIKMCIEEGHEK